MGRGRFQTGLGLTFFYFEWLMAVFFNLFQVAEPLKSYRVFGGT